MCPSTRLGPWLALMIAYSILVSLYPVIQLAPILWHAAMGEAGRYAPFLLVAATIVSPVVLANIAGSFMMLVHRRSRSVTVMIFVFVLAGGISILLTLMSFDYAPDDVWEGRESEYCVALLRGWAQALHVIVAYAGWIAYLLTAPRIFQLYAGRPVSIEADDHKAVLPLRPLLFGLPLWTLIELAALFLAARISLDDVVRSGNQVMVIEGPGYQAGIALLLLLPQIAAGSLLGFGQSWRSLRFALCLLWLLPILAGLHWFGSQGSGVKISMLTDPFPSPLPAAFGALGWTAYLLESPYIRRRFKGPSLKERLADVDVF